MNSKMSRITFNALVNVFNNAILHPLSFKVCTILVNKHITLKVQARAVQLKYILSDYKLEQSQIEN